MRLFFVTVAVSALVVVSVLGSEQSKSEDADVVRGGPARVLLWPSSLADVHAHTLAVLANELARRNHHVVWVESGEKKSTVELSSKVVRHHWPVRFTTSEQRDRYLHWNHSDYSAEWTDPKVNAHDEQTRRWLVSVQLCDALLSNYRAEFDKLVKAEFSTLVIDDLYNPCGLALAGKRRDVFVYWSQTGLRPESAWAQHSPNPPSYVPTPRTGLTDLLDFWGRTTNAAAYVRELYVHQAIVQPRIDAIYKRHFGTNFPSAFELERNASINLVNTPPIYDFARSFMPRVNFVGALQCRQAQRLVEPFASFVNGSSPNEDAGFVVISGGFHPGWKHAPTSVRKHFLNAFAALQDIRFVWQYDGPAIDKKELPANVLLSSWLPLQDLLGHPLCRGHVSHGGLNSLVESVWHGKPVLGVPRTADQHDNLLRLTARGAGTLIRKERLNRESLIAGIRQLYLPKIRQEVTIFQDMVRDVPYGELEHAAFWVEFIHRHGEVPHARSGADVLNILQYFLVDVLLFMAAVTIIVLHVIFFAFKLVFRLIRRVISAVFGGGKSAEKGEAKKGGEDEQPLVDEPKTAGKPGAAAKRKRKE